MTTRRGLFGLARAGKKQPEVPVDSSEVARIAYALYEQRGRESGHDLEDWLRAETIVRARAGSRAAAPRKR